MSVSAQRALRSDIDRREFAQIYYLHGDDDYRKDEAVARLIAAAVDPATKDFNLDVFQGTETDAQRLATALSSLPVLAERRVVIVRDIGALKKAARATLDRYVRSSFPETVLVLTSPAGDKPDATIEAHATSVPFAPLSVEQANTWLVQHARAAGMTLSSEGAALILEAVAGDLTHAVGELDKLASYANGRAIEPGDVEAIVGVRRGETLGDLLEAVAARDARRACQLYAPVLAQPKVTAVQVVMLLTIQTIAMAYGRSIVDAGTSASRLESELFALLKSRGGYVGREWRDAVKSWARHHTRWTAADLRTALVELHAADVALKDTRVSSDEAMIASLVLALCARTPRRSAA